MEERTQEYDLNLVGGSSTVSARAVVAVRDWTDGGRRHRTCSITLTWPGHAVDATSHSVYHAFQDLRMCLEREGLTPDCYGACPDVQVSRMQLDMGDGTCAYRMAGVPHGHRPPTVNIFETEPELSFGTVARQREYWERSAASAALETLRDRLTRWMRPIGEFLTKDLRPASPPAAAIANHPESRTGSMRPSLKRLIALHNRQDVSMRMDAFAHALFVAMQEIAVLKTMLREKSVWDEALYRRAKTDAMIQDRNSAGDFPNTSHSYYPFMLDEEEFLRFAFEATDADLARYDAEVRRVSYLT